MSVSCLPAGGHKGARSHDAVRWDVVWIASAAMAWAALNLTLLFTSLGVIRSSGLVQASTNIAWLASGYAVAYAVFLVPAGKWGELHGHRRLFFAGVLLCTLGAVACAAAARLEVLTAARIVQAAGAAMLTPSSLALLLNAFPSARQRTAVCLWGSVGASAALLGPALGAALTSGLGWRWLFVLQGPVGVCALLLARRVLVGLRSDDPSAAIDRPGLALVIGGALGMLAALCGSVWELGVGHA